MASDRTSSAASVDLVAVVNQQADRIAWLEGDVAGWRIKLAELREAVLGVADGQISDPCWCGEEWWEVHDAHADEREHSEWCARLRGIVLTEEADLAA